MSRLPDKILIVRHGARLDETMPAIIFRDVDVGYDTPLTYGGFKQSQALGAYIAQLLLLPGNPDRRKKRIIIHSSPFTRCVQTSIGIAAGMAQVVAPTPAQEMAQGAGAGAGADTASSIASPYSQVVVRIDPWLGEWMTEQYFEHWDAALLRSSEIVMRARALLTGVAEAEGIRVEPEAKPKMVNLENMIPSIPAIHNLPLQTIASARNDALYRPPKPNHAVLSSDAIPKGYVAHARDACIHFDETWVGLRDGGTYGERWSAFHARISAGLRELLQWYHLHRSDARSHPRAEWQSPGAHESVKQDSAQSKTNPNSETGEVGSAQPPRAANDTNKQASSQISAGSIAASIPQNMLIDDDGLDGCASDEELIIILVTHAGGCNKLLHFLTQKPVLIDFPHSSMIMAMRNTDFSSTGQLECLARQYRTVLQASTDHLNPTTRFRTIKDLSVADVKLTRQSRSSSRSNRRTTLTSVPPITTVSPIGLWGQTAEPETGSKSASAVKTEGQGGLWRPNGETPIRRATLDHLDSLPTR